MKFIQTEYGNGAEILMFKDHYVSLSAVMDDTGITADANGKKIVPKGTLVGGASASVFADRSQRLRVSVDSGGSLSGPAIIDGLLLEDVDVTYGPKACALLIHGFVKTDALPSDPTATQKAAFAPDMQISFIEH